jgi:hypothetical protein
MLPPQWALANSKRLDLDEFGSRFAAAWSQVQTRFLKFECWQTYQERQTNESQDAYNKGYVDRARRLLREEAETDQPLYEDIRKRRIDYARVRLIQEPLTSYLEYELMAYKIREEMGEVIMIVRCGSELRLPNENYFDFLLFDRYAALIHDYGAEGCQSGGWITRDFNIIIALEKIAAQLRASAIPLRDYVADREKRS